MTQLKQCTLGKGIVGLVILASGHTVDSEYERIKISKKINKKQILWINSSEEKKFKCLKNIWRIFNITQNFKTPNETIACQF